MAKQIKRPFFRTDRMVETPDGPVRPVGIDEQGPPLQFRAVFKLQLFGRQVTILRTFPPQVGVQLASEVRDEIVWLLRDVGDKDEQGNPKRRLHFTHGHRFPRLVRHSNADAGGSYTDPMFRPCPFAIRTAASIREELERHGRCAQRGKPKRPSLRWVGPVMKGLERARKGLLAVASTPDVQRILESVNATIEMAGRATHAFWAEPQPGEYNPADFQPDPTFTSPEMEEALEASAHRHVEATKRSEERLEGIARHKAQREWWKAHHNLGNYDVLRNPERYVNEIAQWRSELAALEARFPTLRAQCEAFALSQSRRRSGKIGARRAGAASSEPERAGAASSEPEPEPTGPMTDEERAEAIAGWCASATPEPLTQEQLVEEYQAYRAELQDPQAGDPQFKAVAELARDAWKAAYPGQPLPDEPWTKLVEAL